MTYLERLLEAARRNSPELFYNGSPDHARDILTAIFTTTRHDVAFVTRRLDLSVFGDEAVVAAAKSLVNRGMHMRILFDEDPAVAVPQNHPFVNAIRESCNVEVRQVSALAQNHMPYHFTVSDKHAYRFEPDKSKFEAVACMHDVIQGENFSNIFDSLWESGIERSLPA